MIGFNLLDANNEDVSKRIVDVCFDYPNQKTGMRLVGLFENEIDLYGNALSNIRITHNLKPFDEGRLTDITEIGKFTMTFFEFNEAYSDEYGFLKVKDPAYKSCTLSANNHKFTGRLKTGYRNIDDFVNNYCVIRLDTGKVYSPFNTLLKTSDNDIVSIITMFGDEANINGFTIVNGTSDDPDTKFIIDGEEVIGNNIMDHPRILDIIVAVLSHMLRNSNLIFITREDIATFYDKLKIASSYTDKVVIGIAKGA